MLTILVGLLPLLHAEDSRTIPLDLYLIVDGSSSFQNSQSEAIAWVNSQVVDRILIGGDNISIWNAGDTSRLVFSGAVPASGQKGDIKNAIGTLTINGRSADFSGALKDVAPRVSRTPQERLSCTMLITASAEGLENTLSGDSLEFFRWFRSEKYERWQVLVIGTDITGTVRNAARSYMSSQR